MIPLYQQHCDWCDHELDEGSSIRLCSRCKHEFEKSLKEKYEKEWNENIDNAI